MTHDTPSTSPAPASATDAARTAWYSGTDCACSAPLATDGRTTWCVRGAGCPALVAPPLPPQCPHGLDWLRDCTDCQEEADEAERLHEDAVWRAGAS